MARCYPESAERRILRDMKSMHESPVPTVNATFADDSYMREVHCNLFPPEGPFANLPFHCVVKFGPYVE
jgi:ubiquitin-protein ligase